MCKYESSCTSYQHYKCECEPELCWLYEMFQEEEIKQKLYHSHIKIAT